MCLCDYVEGEVLRRQMEGPTGPTWCLTVQMVGIRPLNSFDSDSWEMAADSSLQPRKAAMWTLVPPTLRGAALGVGKKPCGVQFTHSQIINNNLSKNDGQLMNPRKILLDLSKFRIH